MDVVLAISAVAASSAACAARGDLATARVLADYYALAAAAASAAGGRVVKVIGDGVLFTFAKSQARDAVSALQTFQGDGTRLWQAFDQRCRVQLKIGAGSVVAGLMGPPADMRFDICGDALNQLFKMPVADWVISAEAQSLLS